MTRRYPRGGTGSPLPVPLALLFGTLLVTATTPRLASGHGPETKPPVTLPPGAVIPPGPAPTDEALRRALRSGGTAAMATTGVRPLRQLQSDASAVVHGQVARTETFDEDRLRIYRVRVERVLQGRLDDGEVGVVDIRGASQRPALLADGEHVILLLAAAPKLSYLTEHAPDAGALWTLAGSRDGVLLTSDEAEVTAIEQALADGRAIAALPAGETTPARRTLAFAELAGSSPRLAADALVELRLLPSLTPLTAEETATLAKALRDRRVTPATRVGLATLLAERTVKDAVPALATAELDTPEVLEAVLAARVALGDPPERAEIEALLRRDDPAVRGAALRVLGATGDPAVVPELGRYTSDADATVRVAAVEALGRTGRREALPVLATTFDRGERDLTQRAGRAMLEIGGPALDETLIDLALKSTNPELRTYAAVILVTARGRESASVRRLEAANPSPEVKHFLEHGLEFKHSHTHN